jgi:hypothetical protein
MTQQAAVSVNRGAAARHFRVGGRLLGLRNGRSASRRVSQVSRHAEPVAGLRAGRRHQPWPQLPCRSSYSGSNLVDSLHGRGGRWQHREQLSRLDGLPNCRQHRPGRRPQAFRIEFVDGLFFQSQTTGSWSTCAPKGGVFYGGGQCFTFPVTPTDFGSSSSYSGAALVPEPESWAMMGLGLAIVLGWQRRRGNRQGTRSAPAPMHHCASGNAHRNACCGAGCRRPIPRTPGDPPVSPARPAGKA